MTIMMITQADSDDPTGSPAAPTRPPGARRQRPPRLFPEFFSDFSLFAEDSDSISLDTLPDIFCIGMLE
jgi:hypothetical protein